jgi:DNA-binding MarR family transcriptional regulator
VGTDRAAPASSSGQPTELGAFRRYVARLPAARAADQAGGARPRLRTAHSLLLLQLALQPGARLGDVVAAAGLSAGRALPLLRDLEAAGYVERKAGARPKATEA